MPPDPGLIDHLEAHGVAVDTTAMQEGERMQRALVAQVCASFWNQFHISLLQFFCPICFCSLGSLMYAACNGCIGGRHYCLFTAVLGQSSGISPPYNVTGVHWMLSPMHPVHLAGHALHPALHVHQRRVLDASFLAAGPHAQCI